MTSGSRTVLPKFLKVICLAALAFSPGCATFTVQQGIALGTAAIGNAYATYELGLSGGNLKGLEDLAAALPKIPLGQVSPTQLGVINAELAMAQKGAPDKLQSQIGSLISLIGQANLVSTGGNVTMTGGAIIAQLQDTANGITNAIQFWQGQQSVINPGVAVSPSKPPSQ